MPRLAQLRALTRELLILHPVRDDAVLPQPAHLVGLVVLEVALEPLDMAVALALK